MIPKRGEDSFFCLKIIRSSFFFPVFCGPSSTPNDVRDVEVASSNLVAPTIFQNKPIIVFDGGLSTWNRSVCRLPDSVQTASSRQRIDQATLARRCLNPALLGSASSLCYANDGILIHLTVAVDT